MATKLSAARVLCDVPSHGLKAGQVLEAAPGLIKTLAENGDVDPHKDAVAYARESGAEVVRSAAELATEQRAQRADELRLEIASLQELAAKADADEATKNAAATKALQLQAELAELVG